MSQVDQQLYQQLILDHNRKPRNFCKLEDYTHFAEGFNPLCGDRYDIYMHVDANGLIDRLSFECQGCAISKASASQMTDSGKGKSIEEARALFNDFRELLKGNEAVLLESTRLGKLKIFAGIWKYPSRVKCASLAWHTMAAATEHKEQVSTE